MFCLVCSSFFSASCFLDLYFTIPAASSNTFLLSSDLLLSISSILPCPIMEYPSLPIPVSMKSSWISLSLQLVLFIKYSLSPERYILRIILISVKSTGICLSLLSIHRDTSAKPRAFLLSLPAKMTSSILLPLKALTLCSPNTHLIASDILLLPLPFGPTIAFMVFPKLSSIFSAKDLKPCISSCFKNKFSHSRITYFN